MKAKRGTIVAIMIIAVAGAVLHGAPRPSAAAPLQYGGPKRVTAQDCYNATAYPTWELVGTWAPNHSEPTYWSTNWNNYTCGHVWLSNQTEAFDIGARALSHCYASDSPPNAHVDGYIRATLSGTCSEYTVEVSLATWPTTTTEGAPDPGEYVIRGSEAWGLLWQTAQGQQGPAINVQYVYDCDGFMWTYAIDDGFFC